MLARRRKATAASAWWSVTPRAGLQPYREQTSLTRHLATVRSFTVMPQDRRLTAFWEATPGFVDALVLELRRGERLVRRLELEPEVCSLSLDASRGAQLKNGQCYTLQLSARFGGELQSAYGVRCIPAPQGQEREANHQLPQGRLIYPSLALSPEVCIFPEEHHDAEGAATERPQRIVCCHCRRPVRWSEYRLRCEGCGVEFIPNGRGYFLDLGQLRFGTCSCCLPRKILIQRDGDGGGALACAHSGKEHIRLPGSTSFHLIEDLPHGLCQCCRPRRPLIRKGRGIRCSRSAIRLPHPAGPCPGCFEARQPRMSSSSNAT